MATRVVVQRTVVRIVVGSVPSVSSGTTDHALLTNRSWTLSGHTGTASRLAGFDAGNVASLYVIGTSAGTLAAGDHAHTGVYDPAGTAAAAVVGLLSAATAASTYQPLDGSLTALAALSTTGMLARTAANTYVPRTIVASGEGLVVTNGNGVSGAPTVALADDMAAIEALTPADNDVLQRKAGAWANRTMAQIRADLVAGTVVVMPADVSNSVLATDVLATGATFAPAASSTYLVEVWGACYAAATTTGISWRIGDGVSTQDGTAAVWLQARGGSAFSPASTARDATAGTYCFGISTAGTSAAAPTLFWGSAIWTSDASPAAVGIYFRPEIDGSLVTLIGGRVAVRWTLLS